MIAKKEGTNVINCRTRSRDPASFIKTFHLDYRAVILKLLLCGANILGLYAYKLSNTYRL